MERLERGTGLLLMDLGFRFDRRACADEVGGGLAEEDDAYMTGGEHFGCFPIN